MIRWLRLLALPVLLCLCYTLADARQQPSPPTFTWSQYKGADGKTMYPYPKWYAVNGGVSMEAGAQGVVGLAKDCSITGGTMRVEVPFGGGWATAFEDKKLTIGFVNMNQQTVSGSDPTPPPKVVFGAGSDVRVTWILQHMDAQNAVTTVTFGPYQSKAEVK